MTATGDDIHVELDDKLLEQLAGIICGGDDSPVYRTGWQIKTLFETAGWRRVGDVDGGRRDWVTDLLRQHRRDSDGLHRLLLRLADPREYLENDDDRIAVVTELNTLLALDGYQIVYTGSRPELITQAPSMNRPAMRTPVELTADLTTIVSDPRFGQQLRHRLAEAHTCWQSGACLAAVIMLGSTLEGVLYDVALARHTTGPRPSDHLDELIRLAERQRWIGQDLIDYLKVLRNHRNLIHPKKQWTQQYTIEDDTVRIAWNVVVAAINDLHQLPRPAPPRPTAPRPAGRPGPTPSPRGRQPQT
ncbi:hypothetical protein [Actinoplanes sp. NPDC026670]|uniref:hypothetical protein n=1 Tax=Actinoplanes sp. NPDC026670 TaxID=3154700 RepID=UPI0033D135CA